MIPVEFYSSPRTNGPKIGTGTEWQSYFTTAYQNHRHRLTKRKRADAP